MLYFFYITLRVEHQGRLSDERLYKAATGDTEEDARRSLLNHYFERGFRVVRLMRAESKTTQVE